MEPAKITKLTSGSLGMSLMNMRKNSGHEREPWGTELITGLRLEKAVPTLTM